MPSILTPLDAIQVAGDVSHGIARKLTQLSTAAGKFSVRPNAVGPVGTHPVRLELTTIEEIDDFWTWYDTILGACEPFWLPTYQRDFVPIAAVGSSDVAFSIQDRGYRDFEFPDPLRRQIAFVLADGTFLKREITDAVLAAPNETITINAALGQEFTQRRNNGICYLLYCRLTEDKVAMDWWDHETATVEFSVTELREAAPSGSTL